MRNYKVWGILGQGLAILTLTAVLGGCGGSSDASSSDSGATAAGASVAGVSPSVSGTPPTTVAVHNSYSFRPTVTNPVGTPLNFSIQNKPAWASFAGTSGELSGTPATTGTYPNIVIAATDGASTSALPAFSIQVTAAGAAAAGGSSSSSSSSGGASTSAATPSASGTMVPTNAKQITDSALTVWTLSSGVVYEQATGAASASAAGYSTNVALLLYYNGVVYQENNTCLWWSWSGSAWVAATNPAPSATPACSSSVAAAPAVSTGVGVAVSGNTFINTATGKPVVLAGANLDGLDGSGGYGGAGQINQWNIIAGITPAQWAAIAAKWGINTIRLPMNSAYWLNNTVYDDPAAAAIDTGACCYTSIGTGEYTPDASGTYQSVIATIVSNITAAGIVVGLDLHCDAPKNSSGQYIACVGETALPSVDSALPFWTQVANTFKSNPLVIFGLYNEPYGGYNYNSAPGAVIGGGTSAVPGATAVTMITGGPLAPFTMLASDQTLVTLSGGAALNTIGMVDLITAIRNTGATNVILAPPIWYSGQIQTWLDSYTTTTYGRTSAGNPDPIGQLGVDWHDYGWSSGTSTPLAILAAGYPILMTETYGFDSALDGGSNASGYTWAASNGIGVQVWAWATWASGGASSSTAFYNYLLSTPPWAEGGAAAPTGNTFGQSPL